MDTHTSLDCLTKRWIGLSWPEFWMKVGNKKKQVTFSVRLTIHHVSAAVVWCVVFLLELHKKKSLGRIKKPTIACYKN